MDQSKYILILHSYPPANKNLSNLQAKQPSSSKSTIALFGSYDPDILFPAPGAKVPKPKAIADPYYGGGSGFDDCYQQCVRYAEGFLDMLEKGTGR
jgi:low molecular weight phosphotyrosine protein phosphatase